MHPTIRTPRNPISPNRATAAALLFAVAFLPGAARSSDEKHGDSAGAACVESSCGDRCQDAVARARQSTAAFLRENRALAAGYVPDAVCVAVPGVGGMGYHYVDVAAVRDLDVDPRRPEILVYEERPDGSRALVALEYFAPVLSSGVPWMGSASQPPPTVDNPPPVLFGRTFDGPMPGHAPGMPWHYDLHVWAWKHNPAGLFAQFNPKVRCP
jgi:hypothetical protein